MNEYILSILGIVFAGIFIDILIPNGAISKYIKSIYSIFVVAVILNPIILYLNKTNDFVIKYQDIQLNEKLLTYIAKKKVQATENTIESSLNDKGYAGVDIKIDYILENDEITLISCNVNLENLAISTSNQHINKYEFISEEVIQRTNLEMGEITFNEWKRKKTYI